MKIAIICLISLLLVGCNNNVTKENKTPVPVNTPSQEQKVEEVYRDDNPIKIGLYRGQGNADVLVHEYKTSWENGRDILLFSTYFINDEETKFSTARDMVEYMKKYENIDKYRIGYNLKFSLVDGNSYDVNVLKPGDDKPFVDYINVFLYDDIYHQNDSWYSHITEDDFNDNTYMTSIKLYGSNIEKVKSPILLTTFTYDGKEDFDEEGNYRGNSYYTARIVQ